MDILGIGGWELIAIILIMLVVAGPKRMIQWSYTAGKYVAVMRQMWAETAKQIQKEFDDAGVDVRVPKDIPTRASIGREINRALTPITKPIQESMNATKTEIEGVKKAVDVRPAVKLETSPAAVPEPAAPESAATTTPAPGTNGNGNGNGGQDFGTWSKQG
ncbi:MAG: hypothetical protein ABI835_18815 [Chloroflexota bacterium]